MRSDLTIERGLCRRMNVSSLKTRRRELRQPAPPACELSGSQTLSPNLCCAAQALTWSPAASPTGTRMPCTTCSIRVWRIAKESSEHRSKSFFHGAKSYDLIAHLLRLCSSCFLEPQTNNEKYTQRFRTTPRE